jgi:hypothetical protein
MIPKPTRYKNEKYEKWLRGQPCLICGAPGESHHLKGVGNMSGGALKAPSWAVMCLCHTCHLAQHYKPTSDQWELICRQIGRGVDAGVIKIFGK